MPVVYILWPLYAALERGLEGNNSRHYINGLEQIFGNSSVLAMQLLHYWNKPSISFQQKKTLCNIFPATKPVTREVNSIYQAVQFCGSWPGQ